MNPKSGPTSGEKEKGGQSPFGAKGDCPPFSRYRFEIFRYSAAQDGQPRFQSYDLSVQGNMSVLEALLKIQDEQDPSLAFRYSCRGAVCGSCAMSVNGKLNLACRVQLKSQAGNRVVVEPLPGFEIVKDLVVDMEPFWERYERIRPWLHAAASTTKENPMSERQRQRIDQYVNCILCGLCHAACPVTKSCDSFTGPAALAKLYRFLADSREHRDGGILAQENAAGGVWRCHTIMECASVCPKDVRPSDGIRGVRRALLLHKIKTALGRIYPTRLEMRRSLPPKKRLTICRARYNDVKIEQSCLARRRFLCDMLGGGAAALAAGIAVPLLQYTGNFHAEPPPDFLEIAKADYDFPPGKSKIIMYGPIPALLIRTPGAASKLTVFVAICTHLDCTVGYQEEKNRIFCACHEGYYDTDGRVLSGPPPQPLRQFFSKFKDGKLIIALEKKNLEKTS